MKRLYQQKGFTLVELAIVLTIVGLLIGGILKGQQLIANARVTAQMAQIKGIEAAVTTFNDTYSGLPGDLNTASTRIPGCTGAAPCFNGTGVGTVGAVSAAPINTVAAANSLAGENANFWVHLSDANLISGVQTTGGAVIGGLIPYAKVNSSAGIVVTQLAPPAATNGLSGIYLTVTMVNAAANMAYAQNAGTGNTGTLPMTPSEAAQIDRKMDDGLPLTGNVVAYGASGTTDCNGGGAPAGVYTESNQAKDCGLNFYIQ